MKEENILMQIGLGEEQAILYQALLDKGPQKATDLAKWTGLKRTSIYKILQELESMSVIEKKDNSGSVAVFFPNHPSKLLSRIEEKQKELEASKELLSYSFGSLVSKYNLINDKPNVQFFEGKEGIEKVLEDTLTSKETIYSYADLEAIIKYIPELNEEYSKKREKLKIIKHGIILDTTKSRETIENYLTEVTETKFIKSNFPEFSSVMQIYDGKISYITLKDDAMMGVIIEDRTIYDMHKAVFNSMWELIK